MATTTADNIQIIGGIDTHQDLHTAAVVSHDGTVLGTASFSTTRAGYRAMLRWFRSHGELLRVGVESTGTYGAGITRHLALSGIPVLEVTGPDPASRRAKCKDDALDAISAAEAARTRRRVQVAKDRSGTVEALRVLRTTRKTAIKCRRAALQQLHNTIVAAPEEVRDQVRNLTRMQRLRTCAAWRPDTVGYRWGHTQSEIGYHGGRVKVQRPRVRDHAGKEVGLESWQVLRDGNLLLEWALNLMVLNVSTRKYHRAVRLPEGDLAKARGDGTSKSAVSRRFVALSRKKMKAWLASDLSELDLLVIQIDGLHVGDHVLVAAIGVDGNGDKHVLAVVEGATENTVVVQALLDNLLARGLDPTLPRLFIVDGAKALSKAIRNTFGVAAAIQRCQVHKGRNIIERLPLHLHASVKKALRQAWDQDDADKAERLLRNLARRLEHEEPGVSGSILEGLEEILTVIRLGLPHELRRSLACTNIIENALGTVRQVTRNVKRWRNAEMALRWTAAGLLEAQKTFRGLKAYRQLPILRNALQEHLRKAHADSAIETIMKAA